MNRKLKLGSTYKHFKGCHYLVIMEAYHVDLDTMMVVYQQLENRTIYVRAKAEFLSLVDTEKYPNAKQEWRFEELS